VLYSPGNPFFVSHFFLVQYLGNPINGMFGISPLTVAEYLYSANHDLLIPLIVLEYEEDNFGDEPEGNDMYYHLV
jgi:hypothetical protein